MRTLELNQRAATGYLRHHLVGASTVIDLVADRAEKGDPRWQQLQDELVQDREVVEGLLAALGGEPSVIEQAAGKVAKLAVAAGLRVNEMVAGPLDDLLEMELIRIGIEGRKCLWRLLAASPEAPFAEDWAELLRRADRHAQMIEELRVASGRAALLGDREG